MPPKWPIIVLEHRSVVFIREKEEDAGSIDSIIVGVCLKVCSVGGSFDVKLMNCLLPGLFYSFTDTKY